MSWFGHSSAPSPAASALRRRMLASAQILAIAPAGSRARSRRSRLLCRSAASPARMIGGPDGELDDQRSVTGRVPRACRSTRRPAHSDFARRNRAPAVVSCEVVGEIGAVRVAGRGLPFVGVAMNLGAHEVAAARPRDRSAGARGRPRRRRAAQTEPCQQHRQTILVVHVRAGRRESARSVVAPAQRRIASFP